MLPTLAMKVVLPPTFSKPEMDLTSSKKPLRSQVCTKQIKKEKNSEFLTYLFSTLGHKNVVEIGMDVAASEFWHPEKLFYDLDFKTPNNDGKN